MERFTVGEVLLPGWAYLQGQIDDCLGQLDPAKPCMAWDPKRERPALRYGPHTLLDALWLQFADAVDRDKVFGQCQECGKWFEIAPDAARTHRRFCSNSCRGKAYRERQDKARQLFTVGKTFEEIADELDSDVATVRRWITGSKE